MDTGSCIVARIPTSIAGPPRLTTNSEVATMTYCELIYLHALSRLKMQLKFSPRPDSTVQNLASHSKNLGLER